MSKEAKILLGVGIVIIAAGWALAKFGGSSPTYTPPADPGKLVRSESHMTGLPDAKVTLVEFADYQCPFCAQSAPIVKQIADEYKDNKDFSFVYRHFPLPQHQHAKTMAQAAEAAGSQGKFWEMSEKIYTGQNAWASSPQPLDILAGYAQELGLDVDKFLQEIKDEKYTQQIQTDLADAQELGVNSTPTFYLNGQKLPPGTSYDSFKNAIETELKK